LKEEILLKEKINLLEKELLTLTEKVETMSKSLKDIDDLNNEIKGLKMFIGGVHPELKSKLPELMRKIFKKR
jgi:hypothetical protein